MSVKTSTVFLSRAKRTQTKKELTAHGALKNIPNSNYNTEHFVLAINRASYISVVIVYLFNYHFKKQL